MSDLPMEVSLSKATTNKFSLIKQRTGITPNLMGRVALMKALESNVKLNQLRSFEYIGQKIPKDVFFGDDEDIYQLAVALYIKESGFEGNSRDLVNMLVDFGSHSIPSIRSIVDIDAMINLKETGDFTIS